MKKQKIKIKLGKSENRISVEEQFEETSYSYCMCYSNIGFRNRNEKSTTVLNTGCLVLQAQTWGVQTETTRPIGPTIVTLCPSTEKSEKCWHGGFIAPGTAVNDSWRVLSHPCGSCLPLCPDDSEECALPGSRECPQSSKLRLSTALQCSTSVVGCLSFPVFPAPSLVCWETACRGNDLPWNPQVSGKWQLTYQPNIGLFEVELFLTWSWMCSDIELWCFNMGVY